MATKGADQPRQRGAPLDLIVAEAMILANSTWGNWLAELGVPASTAARPAWRRASRCAWAPRRCRTPASASKLRLEHLALRRYTDLVNQWQIIACAHGHGKTAALAALQAWDAELFSIISGFDAAYSAYNGYQAGMERFWTLKPAAAGHHRAGGHRVQGRLGGSFRCRHAAAGVPVMVLARRACARRAAARPLGAIDEIALDVPAPCWSGWTPARQRDGGPRTKKTRRRPWPARSRLRWT